MRLFNRKEAQRRDRFQTYAKGVWYALALEFEWDEDVRALAWKHMENPTDQLEFICDSPYSAHYKLKFYRGKFHLSYYGMNEVDNEHAYVQALLETSGY